MLGLGFTVIVSEDVMNPLHVPLLIYKEGVNETGVVPELQ
jgi:hypothetical protein